MAEHFIEPLMAAERMTGYHTDLVTSGHQSVDSGEVIYFDLSISNLIGLPWALLKILNYIYKIRPDIVIAHNSKSSLIPLFAAWLGRVPVRVYFNHGVPYVGYHGFLRVLLRLLERLNALWATHVLTVSKEMLGLLLNAGVSREPKIIHHGSACGIDLQVFSSDVYSHSNWRNTHGLKADDLLVVYVGRPERRKGFEIVLRLWADYIHERHIKLVICGADADDVLRYLNSVPQNVLPFGFVQNVPEILASSDLLLLPSFHEGLPYACMEAQASGAVVVANNIVGLSCVVEDGITGFLVPGNEISKYLEIIRRIDLDRSSIEDIRLSAKKRVSKYSRENFMPHYIAYLRGLH